MKLHLVTAALLIKLCTTQAFTQEIPTYTLRNEGFVCPLSGSGSCWSSPPNFETTANYIFDTDTITFPSNGSCVTYGLTINIQNLSTEITQVQFSGTPNGTVTLNFQQLRSFEPCLVEGTFLFTNENADYSPAFFMQTATDTNLSINGRLVFERLADPISVLPINFTGTNITLNDQGSFINTSILFLQQPLVFKSNATLTFELSPDYLNNLTNVPLNNEKLAVFQFQPGAGYIDENTCKTNGCSSLNNYTCNIFLDEAVSLSVKVRFQEPLTKPIKNQPIIALFPDAVGCFQNIYQECCLNSENLTSDNGFLAGAISLFDPLFNTGTLSIENESASPYIATWSNIPPNSYSNLTGPGFVSSYQLYPVTYGVNGVFGLWIDISNKHQTQAHLMGTNSPHFTATMLNTMHKCMQMQTQVQTNFDAGWFSLVSDHSLDSASNEIAAQDSFIAQQSMVQQLAERNTKTPIKHWSVYVEPRGSWGQIFQQNKHQGNTFQTAGTRAGFDYLWNNANNNSPLCIGLGFVTDYLHTWGQRKHHSGNFSANEGLGNLYLALVPKKIPELSINLIGGGGYSWYTFHRDLFEDSTVVATGKSSGPEADLFVELEYVFRHKRFSAIPKDFKIVPIGALQYTYTKINSYKEKGAGRYNLKVDAQDASTLSTLLGFRTNYEFKTKSDIAVTPELSILWQYQYLDPSITSTSSYILSGLGPDILSASLSGLPRNTLIVGADVKVEIYDYAQVQLDYDFFYNSGFITNVFFLNLKGKF